MIGKTCQLIRKRFKSATAPAGWLIESVLAAKRLQVAWGISLNAANSPCFPVRLQLVDFNDYGESATCSDSSGMLRFTPQLEQLPALMDVAQLRQRVISQNLANVNTPGYKRLDVEFEETLARVLEQQDSVGKSGVSNVAAKIVEDTSTSVRADGNNVDVDRELGQLNKNAMLFQMYSQLMRSQFDAMRRAIESPR